MSDQDPSEDIPEKSSIPIPSIFYSDMTGKAMECCVKCERNLLESNEPYIVEKAFRYYPEYEIKNTIFEYIMCLPCAQEMNEAMSKESQQKIQEYFSRIDLMGRGKYLLETYGTDIDSWLENCIVKHHERKHLEEYQICAQCVGDKMIFNVFPYMLSHEASNEVTDLLSNQTLDEYNRFVDDFFGLPPEFKKALKDSPAVLV